MRIYPAIDIIDGRCVRLVKGDFEQVSVYNEDPAAVAKTWESMGAEYLHIVDLDGARKGTAHNDETVKKILQAVSIPVQIGGGVRTIADIKAKLDMGIARVILGTVAVTDPDLTKEAIAQFGKAVAVGVDASNGKVAITGWTSVSDIDSVTMISQLGEAGVDTVIYTDVAKDGMMSGPNIPMYREVAKLSAASAKFPNIIAAGGVTTIEDVKSLADTGIAGAIIGKALYLDAIDLREAIGVAR
ncbi:MAG: 1-(5-phosphoribosyl)-5-[(5-phosphoribosylamino)methylideneamino]imidazole-4-carboxamide isomerase [Defluviitaleaceae bacterium]|nr:1-(5-phosphoribosyl)-5-[(5-phosphoribosylamino)methylideneamino]imidazole-4-carboxamide isomerase [Defluviitaleaceae bacterium]